MSKRGRASARHLSALTCRANEARATFVSILGLSLSVFFSILKKRQTPFLWCR